MEIKGCGSLIIAAHAVNIKIMTKVYIFSKMAPKLFSSTSSCYQFIVDIYHIKQTNKLRGP
jgi:hypothetical protein